MNQTGIYDKTVGKVIKGMYNNPTITQLYAAHCPRIKIYETESTLILIFPKSKFSYEERTTLVKVNEQLSLEMTMVTLHMAQKVAFFNRLNI